MQRRWGRIGIIVALAAVVVAGVGWALTRSDGDGDETHTMGPSRQASPSTTAPGPTEPVAPPPTTILTSAVENLTAYAEPVEASASVTSLSRLTRYEQPRTLMVVGSQPGWFQVLLPIRPNGATGWVRETDVTVTTTTYSVRVELAAHQVTLFDAGQPVVSTGAVIGEPDTPTPLGMFYVTDPVDLSDDPNGPYGAYALGLSGFSEVLMEFSGGPGQIALHGTNRPEQVGQDISNGCVRIPNEVITQIAHTVPLGTPVEIVP